MSIPTGNKQEHGLAQPQEEAKIFMYANLNVSKLAMNRSMGWLSPKRRQRASCMLT
jgi:hypothetical protein